MFGNPNAAGYILRQEIKSIMRGYDEVQDIKPQREKDSDEI